MLSSMAKILFLSVMSAACAALCAAQDSRKVTEPVIPPFCATLQARFAEVDESQPDTSRIQKALDACPQGQAVELGRDGRHTAFLSGPLDLRAGVTLVVSAGATLFASRDPKDYEVRPGSCGVITPTGRGCRALINGDHVAGAAVMGDGVVDGRGGEKILGQDITWWQLADKARAGGNQNNPRIMILNGCDNFILYRITLRNSPNFHVAYNGGNGFTVWGVKVHAPKRARNTDGIDPANSTNVTITRSWIDTGDDNVAIKAGPGKPTSHMTISHNHFYSGHGMSIGSETDGGANAIRVSDLSIDSADNGIRIKSNRSRGGLVHDVVYEDVCIRNTANPILMDTHYTPEGSAKDKLPVFEDITLRNVRIEGGGKITFDGLDQEHRLEMTLDNVTLASPGPIQMKASHAWLKIGPGPVNFRPSGDDVELKGNAGNGKPNACQNKFVPYPAD